VNALYRREASETVRRGGPMPAAMTAVLVVLTAAVIALGVWPGLTGWFTGAAGAAILRR
jgi:hypothetical protein